MNMLTKFPSFDYLCNEVAATFRRFPLALLSAVGGTMIAVYLANPGVSSNEFVLQKLLVIAALGVPLFIAITLFAERQAWSSKVVYAVSAVGIVALVLYYFSLPGNIIEPEMYLVRFLLLNIALHLLVAFLPFIRGKQVDGFWQYNKSLFLRFLIAALYSSVMYIGLTIALAAADYLFGIEVKPDRYLQLWILIVGAFNTWVFLSGIPENLSDMTNAGKYPVGLKVFTQYILLPLVVLYFVILIAYEGKIIFTWNWPKGWVSHLVLWYSVVGILSMLLLHPLRFETGNRWIQVFSKWFIRGLIPLVVMLILAIIRRISDYGITENRYFVMAMAAGLSIVVLYFIFSRAKDIRVIPVVICGIAVLSAYGPWSAFAVSEKSQHRRLESLLVNNEILKEGLITKTEQGLTFEDKKEISNIISYLIDWHGVNSLSSWLSESEMKSIDTLSKYSQKDKIADLMGFEYSAAWQGADFQNHFLVFLAPRSSTAITGYDYLIEIDNVNFADSGQAVVMGDDTFFINFDKELLQLKISLGSDSGALVVPLAEKVYDLTKSYFRTPAPIEEMTLNVPGPDFEAIVILRRVTGYIKEGEVDTIEDLTGQLLIKK